MQLRPVGIHFVTKKQIHTNSPPYSLASKSEIRTEGGKKIPPKYKWLRSKEYVYKLT